MSRKYFNDGQEVVQDDFNDLQSLREQEIYDRVVFEMLQRTENAFFNDSFKVGYVSGSVISVSSGSGFQTDATVSSKEPQKRLLHRAISGNLPISTPDGALDRIDIVVAKHNRITSLQETRKYKATISSTPTNVLFDVEKDWESDVSIIAGAPNASPVAPAVPSGYIKIAELYVSAVTGIANGGAITDSRPLMPVGGALSLNTLGKLRVTAGASVPLTTLISDIDAFLVAGRPEWLDFVTQGADPAAPAAGRQRVYRKGTTFFQRDSGGAITPFGGSGGGGGGGANWVPYPANAPTEDVENNEKVWLFEAGLGQKLTLFVKVPESYVSGQQIKMFLGQYSPSTSNTQKLQSVAYLVRKNNDAIGSTANSYASTNAVLTNTVANQYRDNELDLTNATGQINSFSVSAGDILKVELTRGTDTDTADIRFLPSATEVKFG